jgi:hypothetical protein
VAYDRTYVAGIIPQEQNYATRNITNFQMFSTSETHLPSYRKIVVGKPAGYRTTGRPECKWADNINADFKGTEWQGMG